jgi:hypothetical protein
VNTPISRQYSEPVRRSDGERPISELFSELATETGDLIRAEVKLATTELTHKGIDAARQTAFIVAGATLGTMALLFLLAALALGLGTVMELWLSSLIVGVVVAIVAAVLANHGMRALRDMKLAPTETIDSLKQDKQWIKDQVR